LSKRDRAALCTYIRAIADKLELRDWTIELARDPCDDETEGTADCIYGQRHLTIALHREFRERDPLDQRETIVHELIHAHMKVCWQMVQQDLADLIGKPAYYVFADSYRRAMEYSVDALSKVISRQMPLIEWPRADKRRRAGGRSTTVSAGRRARG
jgi:hypothetical protein